MVFFHHVCFTSIARPGPATTFPATAERWLYQASHFGFYGVDLFFVLSGFLITSILLKGRSSGSYYQDFYWKRALRILPLYLLCLVAILIAFPQSKYYVLLSLLFLANFARNFHLDPYGPFWSLAIEEQFYLLWPTVVRRQSPQRVAYWAAALWIGTILFRIGSGLLGHRNYYITPMHTDGLAAGAFLAARHFTLRARGGLASDGKILLAFILAGVPLTALGYSEVFSQPAVQANLQETGIILFFAGVIGLLIGFAEHPWGAVFRSRPLRFFGLISYALYMTHAFVFQWLSRHAPSLDLPVPQAFWLRLVVTLAISIILCLLTRYLIELPAMSLRRYVLKRPAPPPETAEPLLPSAGQ